MSDQAGAEQKTFFTGRQRFPLLSAVGQDYELNGVLDASAALLPFFDLFGTLMKITKNDFSGNINKLRAKMLKIPQARTFRELFQYELDNKLSKQKDSACIAGLWFKRGLQYLVAFLEKFHENKEEILAPMMDAVYEATLKQYHGWIVQKAIQAVHRMMPYRRDTIKRMTYDNPALESELLEQLSEYISTVKPVAESLHAILIELDLDSSEKV